MPKIKVVCRYGVEYSLLARGIQEEVERLKYRLSKCCCYVCYNCSSCKIHKTRKQECMNECEISGIRFCEKKGGISMTTCRTCKHRQRWMNEFSPKVTQVCELKKGRTQMGFRKIKVTDPACEQYEKKEDL